jgi:SAM-dependent methyltransferase
MTETRLDSIRHIKFWQEDLNGVLTVFPGSDSAGVPFPIARIFTIAGVPVKGSRANHAHRGCSQMLACLSGRVEITVDDGLNTKAIEIVADGTAVLIPPLLWNSVIFDGPSTVLMVICDEPYDPADYIRDREEYLRLRQVDGLPPPPPDTSKFLPVISDTARRAFGYFDEYPPYRIMYPWLAEALDGLAPSSRVLDLGAGISPMPLYFAERGMSVDTVDSSRIVRRLPVDENWNGWGYFDYSAIDASIASQNCEAVSYRRDSQLDAAYSIGMIAHMPRQSRDLLFEQLASWLRPGGRLLFTVDLVKSSDQVWNMCDGAIVESLERHGTIQDIRQKLTRLKYRIDEFTVLRGVEGSRTDILLAGCTRSEAEAANA